MEIDQGGTVADTTTPEAIADHPTDRMEIDHDHDHTEAVIAEALRLFQLDKVVAAAALVRGLPPDRAQDARVAPILHTMAKVRHVRDESTSEDGWTLVREDRGIRASYKTGSDANGAHSVRMQGHVDAPMFNVLAVLCEVDLYTRWMPSNRVLGLRSGAVLSQSHPAHLTVQILLNFPWPLSDRELTLTVHGVDCMDENANADADQRQIVVLLHSADDAADPPPSFVRAYMLEGGVVLTPAALNGGGRGTHVTVIARVDPQLKNIPMSLINFTVQHLAFYFLDLLAEQARNVPNSEYAARIAADARGFYKFVTGRLAAIGFLPTDL